MITPAPSRLKPVPLASVSFESAVNVGLALAGKAS